MEQIPLFSIIIPVYRVEKYIRQCIDSVLAQSFKDYEVLLVDDGSPDNCPNICDKYAKAYSGRVSAIHKNNGGLSDARNCGLNKAIGKYIIFLDSDDYWDSKELLSDLSTAIKRYKNPDVVLFQGKKYFENNQRTVDDILFDSSIVNNGSKDEAIKHLITTQSYSMSACTKAVRRDFLIINSIYFEKGLLGEDLDWFFKLILSARTINAINNCCYVYRIRKESISHSQTIKNELDQIKIIKRWRYGIEQSNIDSKYKKYYFAILSYAFMVALLNYGRLCRQDRKTMAAIIKEQKDILSYAENKKTKITYSFMRLFGIELTAMALNTYYRVINKD